MEVLRIRETPFVANRDIHIYQQNSQWLEERINNLRSKYIELEERYQSGFNYLSETINTISEQLNNVSEEQRSHAAFIEIRRKYEEFRASMKAVSQEEKFCVEAAQWLSEHRSELVQYASQALFDINGGLSLRNNNYLKISPEGFQKFSKDLEFYLAWIGHFMERKLNPRPFKEGSVYLPIEYHYYKEAFELMKRSRIVSDSGLSDESIEMLCRYVNKFLIDRVNQPLDLPGDTQEKS